MQVRELVSALSPTLWSTESLEEAGRRIAAGAESVVVLNLSGHPIAIITESDLQHLASEEPRTWRRKRCACLAPSKLPRVYAEDSPERVITYYREDRIRPLLVYEGHQVIGIVSPGAILRWCAEHQPALLKTLRDLIPARLG